jgi:hypothetical protein
MDHRPGSKVPQSGVYTVVHDPKHRERHDVTCIEGRKFPTCKGCKGLLFRLKCGARHIDDHEAFEN